MATRAFGPVITRPATGKHSATLIMLHGLGDTGNGWAPVAAEIGLPHVKMVFPTAPTRPITCNMGMSMPGWFDIESLDAADISDLVRGKTLDKEGIAQSVRYLDGLVAKENEAGIPNERIVLGGFSQGGVVALTAATSRKEPVAGVAALSTFFDAEEGKVVPDAVKGIPVFIGHGSHDPLVPVQSSGIIEGALARLGFKDVTKKIYPGMPHSACPEEMQDLKDFLERVVPETAPTGDELRGLSAGGLKRYLQARGVSTVGLLEKRELLAAALATLEGRL